MNENNLVVSPCSNPEMTLDEALSAYSEIGYTKFEAFTGWAKSSLDIEGDPEEYAKKAASYGMRFTSMHLAQIAENVDASLAYAIKGARFAAKLGASVVLFKAKTTELFAEAGPQFLDAIDGLGITPVLQNHKGTAITTLDDFRAVIEGINDARMKTLLESGMFHAVGTHWREGCDLLGDSIALVHVKDMVGAQSVPFGTGEMDIRGLYRHLRTMDYTGGIVIEMEVTDSENTIEYLADARKYMIEIMQSEDTV